MTPAGGDAVRVVMTKWGGRPHWEFDATLLGSDEHGDWLGIVRGTVMRRPGATYVAPTHQVGLVPGAGPEEARGWLGRCRRCCREKLSSALFFMTSIRSKCWWLRCLCLEWKQEVQTALLFCMCLCRA